MHSQDTAASHASTTKSIRCMQEHTHTLTHQTQDKKMQPLLDTASSPACRQIQPHHQPAGVCNMHTAAVLAQARITSMLLQSAATRHFFFLPFLSAAFSSALPLPAQQLFTGRRVLRKEGLMSVPRSSQHPNVHYKTTS